jgi:hypothetical protein
LIHLQTRPEKTIRFDEYYKALTVAPERPNFRWPRKTNALQLAAVSAWHKTEGRGFRQHIGWHKVFSVAKEKLALTHLSELLRLGILGKVRVINDEESEFTGYIWLVDPTKKKKSRKTLRG